VVVEVRHVLGQNVFEVAAVDDQHPVEQLAADGACTCTTLLPNSATR
jgi:hypothetical protein